MSSEMKKVFKMFEKQEPVLTPERREELDRAGEKVRQFVVHNSNESIDSHIQSLSREDAILFLTAWYWDVYKYKKSKSRKKVAA